MRESSRKWVLWQLALLTLSLGVAHAAPPAALILEDKESYDLSGRLEILVDPTKMLPVERIGQGRSETGFPTSVSRERRYGSAFHSPTGRRPPGNFTSPSNIRSRTRSPSLRKARAVSSRSSVRETAFPYRRPWSRTGTSCFRSPSVPTRRPRFSSGFNQPPG
jgi:hypothetical protein